MAKYFKPEEFKCKCGECQDDGTNMSPQFVQKLDELREHCGFPVVISSGYRCPEYNNKISKTGLNGPHTTGKAVDILVSGRKARKLVGIAIALGFTGIGVSQKGRHEKRFIHLDTIETGTRPWLWSY